MKAKDMIFGWINMLWLAWTVAFVWFGVIALSDVVGQNCAVSAAVNKIVAKERVVAAIVRDVAEAFYTASAHLRNRA